MIQNNTESGRPRSSEGADRSSGSPGDGYLEDELQIDLDDPAEINNEPEQVPKMAALEEGEVDPKDLPRTIPAKKATPTTSYEDGEVLPSAPEASAPPPATTPALGDWRDFIPPSMQKMCKHGKMFHKKDSRGCDTLCMDKFRKTRLPKYNINSKIQKTSPAPVQPKASGQRQQSRPYRPPHMTTRPTVQRQREDLSKCRPVQEDNAMITIATGFIGSFIPDKNEKREAIKRANQAHAARFQIAGKTSAKSELKRIEQENQEARCEQNYAIERQDRNHKKFFDFNNLMYGNTFSPVPSSATSSTAPKRPASRSDRDEQHKAPRFQTLRTTKGSPAQMVPQASRTGRRALNDLAAYCERWAT
jgi:hypothetical protein